MTPKTVNPDTYFAFLEVLARAPRATTYKCVVTHQIQSGPYAGEFRELVQELPGEAFDQLPWDGELDDILSASWTVPAAYSLHTGVGMHEGLVSVSITHDDGIFVANPYGERPMYAVGRVGVMPGNRRNLDLSNRNALYRHPVETEEKMVAKVLEVLTEGGWENAEKILQREDYDYIDY